jgi:hypothetical protein
MESRRKQDRLQRSEATRKDLARIVAFLWELPFDRE